MTGFWFEPGGGPDAKRIMFSVITTQMTTEAATNHIDDS